MLNLSITQHQNGFLKIALPLGGRLHVWSPWNPPVAGPIAEIHDHPFAFDSFVLAGEMQNVLLSATDHPNGDYIEQTAACVTSFGLQPDTQPTGRRVRLVEEQVDIIRRGECYRMPPWLLHRTDAVFALTLFRKGIQEDGHSRIYGKLGSGNAEFRPAPETLLRMSLDTALKAAKLTIEDIVAIETELEWCTRGNSLVASLPLLPEPGYHLRSIPRSPHGTVGKVVEEAFELAEAAEQGLSIMALCECADLVGALYEYLRRQHPAITFEDVVRMSQATTRAFNSGRRK